MSLDPHWSSTIFAVYVFAGLLSSGLAAVTLVACCSCAGGPLAGRRRGRATSHDLGKLLFAFSTFWAYIWLSQYLLIWYGNLPEEVPSTSRAPAAAGPTSSICARAELGGALPRPDDPRRQARPPCAPLAVAAIVLAGRWLDLYVLAAPAVLAEPHLGPLELLVTAGYAGLFCFAAIALFARASLVPANDPYLHESLGRA